jgi:hypothetical protein
MSLFSTNTDLRKQLNKSVASNVFALLGTFKINHTFFDQMYLHRWNGDGREDLEHSVHINGKFTSNKQFFFRLFNRLVNHVVGFPSIESVTESNVHKSNRDEWTNEQLQLGLDAVWAVRKRVSDFLIRYSLWEMEKISEGYEDEDARQTYNRAKKRRRSESFERRIGEL